MLRRRYFNQQKIVKKEANTLFEGHLLVRYFSISIPAKFRLFRYGLYQIPIFLREHSFCAMAQK